MLSVFYCWRTTRGENRVGCRFDLGKQRKLLQKILVEEDLKRKGPNGLWVVHEWLLNWELRGAKTLNDERIKPIKGRYAKSVKESDVWEAKDKFNDNNAAALSIECNLKLSFEQKASSKWMKNAKILWDYCDKKAEMYLTLVLAYLKACMVRKHLFASVLSLSQSLVVMKVRFVQLQHSLTSSCFSMRWRYWSQLWRVERRFRGVYAGGEFLSRELSSFSARQQCLIDLPTPQIFLEMCRMHQNCRWRAMWSCYKLCWAWRYQSLMTQKA